MNINYNFNETYTEYAPAVRSPLEQVMVDKWNIETGADTLVILDTVPDLLLILNNNRQIVYSNKVAFDYLAERTNSNIYGLKPGEAIGCKHAFESGSGCGTTSFCSTCGAVNAILQSIKGMPDVQECRIAETINGETLDFRVWATPILIKEERYHVFAIKDIADEKRRSILERIFFHDILNLAGGLRGITYLLKNGGYEENKDLLPLMYKTVNSLIDEINAQKLLLEAESEKLEINSQFINTLELVELVADIYRNHNAAEGKNIYVMQETYNGIITSDYTLLKRIIGNMTKNALEASEIDSVISLNVQPGSEKVIFSVHNESYMPKEIQLQVFQRSFSTKGAGRGLGTYSIKLLGERYLGGRVYFESNEENGTTFYIELPVK